MSSGQSELLNLASEYHIDQDELQSALEDLEFEGKLIRDSANNEATDYTPDGGEPWDAISDTASKLNNHLINNNENQVEKPPLQLQESDVILPNRNLQFPDLPTKSEQSQLFDNDTLERMDTPQYLVANDPILAGSSDYFEMDDNSSINQQAVEFMNKLIIQRNAFVDVNAWLDYSKDYFDYDDINMSGLVQKPNNFLMIGKPGIGLTTFSTKFAQKMNLVYISPASVAEYFFNSNDQFQEEYKFGGWDDRVIFNFICQRIQMLDVQYRGYILDGWPVIQSEKIPISEQLSMIGMLPIQPDFVFIMQMQDRDLFKRRIDQKLDPVTMQIYIKMHYIRSSMGTANLEGVAKEILRHSIAPSDKIDSVETFSTKSTSFRGSDLTDRSRSSIDSESQDFVPLDMEIIGRLISRLEDHPAQVERDFEKFRKAVPAIQSYINSLDRTKVFELDAYWTPTIIMNNAMSIMNALGILPVGIPMEIFRPIKRHKSVLRPEDEMEGYSSDDEGCITDPNDPDAIQHEFPPTDWTAVMRAVVVRGRIDPRFRLRISKWKNLCPVALKEGRSKAGRPELAYGLHDKVYFLSSPEAVQKFIFNPRQYLIESMPSSPIKFFIIGHPLAGKTLFAHQLAKLTGGMVVDMQKQIKKRLECVKQRYLFKTRFETTMAAKKLIDRENYCSWKSQERSRREKVKKWIADYIRKKAAEEINKALAADREERMEKYRQMRSASEYHELSSTFKSSPCCSDKLAFSWKKFVQDIRKGKDTWALQEQLELAWELFREGKLQYKSKTKKGISNLRKLQQFTNEEQGEAEQEESEQSDDKDEDDDEDEDESEQDENEGEGEKESSSSSDDETKKPMRRRRKKKPYCKKPKVTPEVAVVTEDEDEDEESSPISSDSEPDESLRLKYPEMCIELTESIPKPSPVCDQDERIQALVKIKLEETQKWADGLPSEIYEEILQMGLRDVEQCFQQRFPHSHFSGGWIVENLILDVEKWRSILRNPNLCPDQVYILQDSSQDHVKLMDNLKTSITSANPGRKISMRKKRMGEVLIVNDSLTSPSSKSKLDLDPQKSFDEMTSYSKDTLESRLCTTESSFKQLEMDRKRQQSRVTSPETFNESEIFYLNSPQSIDQGDIINDGQPICQQICDESNIPSSSVQFSNSVSASCLKSWNSVVNEQKLQLVPLPSSKLVPCEMRIVLDYKLALRLALEEKMEEFDESVMAEEQEENEKYDVNFNLIQQEEQGEWDIQYEAYSKSNSIGNFSNKLNQLENYEDYDANDIDVIKTQSGINSKEFICDLGEAGEDVDTIKCQQGPISIKKSFLKKIENFNEFWNMIYPVMNQEKVQFWQVGIVDQLNVDEKVKSLWNELESRFKMMPKVVTNDELEEDDADFEESKILWGEFKKEISKEQLGEFDQEDEEESTEFSEEEENDQVNYTGRTKDKLKKLEKRPEEYRTTLNEIENNRLFGHYNYFCPVTLYDFQMIRKGSPKFAATFQNRLYYTVSAEALTRFVKDPQLFLPKNTNKCIPPPRICITGAPACGQREVALKLVEKAGIYYVNFRERLHELIKSRLGHDVGPQFTGEIVTKIESESSSPRNSEEDEVSEKRINIDDESLGEQEDFDPNTEWIKEKNERKELELKALKSLGIVDNVQIKSNPMDSISRVEMKADQLNQDGKLNLMEQQIKSFLESGAQLPPSVLDEFIPTLWNEEPFKSTGFILVGFPNTLKDIEYMTSKNCWPEIVYIMDCKKETCKNRLFKQTVETCSKGRKEKIMKNQIEDSLSFKKKIGKALLHHHYIFTHMITPMKVHLNQTRIRWTYFSTDLSLLDAKNKIIKAITPILRYRENIFEATYILYPEEAELLLQKRYFLLSRFKRWCPVEISKGNTGINLWNAPGVTKYPVLYQNYIYFIAGQENLNHFRDNVISITKEPTPTPVVPFHVVVIGPPKAGKTEICKRIAQNLGFLYVHEDTVINRMIQHANATRSEFEVPLIPQGAQPMIFSQKVDTYLRSGHSLPRYMFYRSLDYMLLEPIAQHHGVVFDAYPMEDTSIQEMLERGVIPGLVVQLEIELKTALQRCEMERRIEDYDFKSFVQDCDEIVKMEYESYGPMKSPCIFWYGNQMKCVVNVSGTKNPAEIADEVQSKCISAQVNKQQIVLELINNRTVQASQINLK